MNARKPVKSVWMLDNLQKRIVSLERTGKDGLKMIVARHSRMKQKDPDEGTAKRQLPEKRYEVETDQWGNILTLKELSFDPNRGKWG